MGVRPEKEILALAVELTAELPRCASPQQFAATRVARDTLLWVLGKEVL